MALSGSRIFFASIQNEDLGFFPPTYIEAAEYDCLHDEGIEFGEKLKSQGVPVEVHDMKGTCHGYETAIKSSIVEKCMSWRLEWIRNEIIRILKLITLMLLQLI